MSNQKRHFPYYSSVPEMQLGQRKFVGVNPGKEYSAPRTFVPATVPSTVEKVDSCAIKSLFKLCIHLTIVTPLAVRAPAQLSPPGLKQRSRYACPQGSTSWNCCHCSRQSFLDVHRLTWTNAVKTSMTAKHFSCWYAECAIVHKQHAEV